MTEQTTPEIQERYEGGLSRVTEHYFNALDALRGNAELDDEERSARARAAHETASQLLEQATEQRNRMFEEREATLRRRLFHGPPALAGNEQARRSYDEAVRTVSQQPERAGDFVSLAVKTGNKALARAAFAVADETGEAAAVSAFLDSSPEDRALYEELKSVPDAEERESVAPLPEPTWSQVQPSAEAIEAAQRARALRPGPLVG